MTQSIETVHATARAATTLTALAVLSPIAGLAVEMTLAWCFGASGTVDAFRIASLLLVFGNQLFLGQLLPNVVVPLFSEYRAKGFEQQGWRLAFSLAGILGFIALPFVFWVCYKPASLVNMLGPGLVGTSRTGALLLIRYFSLAFVLMVWSGVMSGVLYAYKILWLLPASQLLTNLLVIVAILAIGREWGSGSLALGILLGSLTMFVLHLYFLARVAKNSGIQLLECFKLGPWDGVIKALRLSVPLVAMIFIVQWGGIIINRVLSNMTPGTIAYFGYAWKLLIFVGILPRSLATVIFPQFSDAQASNNPAEFSRLVTRAIRMTLLMTIPLAAVLFVMRIPLISLLFERGAMSSGAVSEISQLYSVLLIATPANALMDILNKVAFSMQDTKSPAIAVFVSSLMITLLAPFAAGRAGASGVAWAFNAAMWTSTLGLFAYQVWQYSVMRVWAFMGYLGLLMVLSTGIVLPAMAMRILFKLNMPMVAGWVVFELSVITLSSMLVGYGLSRWLGIRETSEIWDFVRWQYVRILRLQKSTQ